MSDEQRDGDKRVFPPPDQPVECYCLHCGRVYTSDMMVEVEVDGEFHYACPVKGCTAMGWDFDIYSTSEEEDEEGWLEDEVYAEEFDLDDFDENATDTFADDDEDEDEEADAALAFDPPREWSPDVDAEDREEEFGEESFEAEDLDRGTVFTREEYEELKASGELDRKIEEIRLHWQNRKDDTKRPASDDDIPF